MIAGGHECKLFAILPYSPEVGEKDIETREPAIAQPSRDSLLQVLLEPLLAPNLVGASEGSSLKNSWFKELPNFIHP